jgi:hypothetical protein
VCRNVSTVLGAECLGVNHLVRRAAAAAPPEKIAVADITRSLTFSALVCPPVVSNQRSGMALLRPPPEFWPKRSGLIAMCHLTDRRV